MRITIDIDDGLLEAAMIATGQATKQAAVEEALRLATQLHRQRVAGRQLSGLGWEGELDAMRDARFPR